MMSEWGENILIFLRLRVDGSEHGKRERKKRITFGLVWFGLVVRSVGLVEQQNTQIVCEPLQVARRVSQISFALICMRLLSHRLVSDDWVRVRAVTGKMVITRTSSNNNNNNQFSTP